MTFALAVLRYTELPVILSLGLRAITTSWVFLNLGFGFENCKIMDLDLDLDLIVKSETGFGFRNIKSAHLCYTAGLEITRMWTSSVDTTRQAATYAGEFVRLEVMSLGRLTR